ncbi:MAG: HIT family hydrolase [Candidatus Omnitrophota bacterium]|nr:MAG: HIT family hydrolase [Candidatus Omnitrophota bacterium]
MDKLWAPWRIKYLKTTLKKGCVFCRSLKSRNQDTLLLKTRYSFCLLNTFPYNNGHLLVLPRRHTADIADLKDEEALDLFRTLSKARKILDKVLRPEGYNLGINISKSAGAGITGHLHIHLVPRWHGDTNFMPVVFNTKVISQSLRGLKKKFKKYAQ